VLSVVLTKAFKRSRINFLTAFVLQKVKRIGLRIRIIELFVFPNIAKIPVFNNNLNFHGRSRA